MYIFMVGLAFGSFTLAMVDRMKSGKDWVKGRSECDSCKHKLSVIDLIPVVSWILQKGKCRYCGVRLSNFYPAAELMMGVAFVISWLSFPYDLIGGSYALLVLWLLALVIMGGLMIFDLRWFLLPNKLVYPLIAVASTHRIALFFIADESLPRALTYTALSVVVSSGLFWAMHRISNGKWIGDGDYRFGIAAGIFLANPFVSWLSLFIASILGLMYALPVYVSSKPVKTTKTSKSKKAKKASTLKIPFGPFLIVGLCISYLYGRSIIDWYSSTFLYL